MAVTNRRKAISRFMVFALIPLSIFTLVLVVPFIRGIYYTFRDWDGFGSTKFVGFDNYREVFKDDAFWHSLWITLFYVLATVILVNLVAFGLALLVTIPMRGVHALRTVFFMPNLIGGVILGLVWEFLFSKTLPALPGPFFNSNWLLAERSALWAMVIVTVWQMSGYMMIVYVTALMSVNQEVLEASVIDGATGFKQMLYIKLPLIVPAFTISLFLTMRNAFMTYDVNLALTGGGPYRSTELISLHVYNEAYTNRSFATGQTQAIIMFVVIAAAALVQVVISKRYEVQA